MKNNCPAPDVLAAFAAGQLPNESRASTQSHVSHCDSCLEAVGFLTSRESAVESEPLSHPALARVDQVIGTYRLIRRIGEGGMGEVWEAQQFAPVRRTVALKLLKAGMDTRQIVSRFQAERQLLALMQHPGIAQMFDAGITDAGRSYFVMEYVEGTRITAYCDQAKLDLRERLELFKQVCDAVQHAHQKGVIHRDIKPSNVLVTTQDDKPLPKVIDFGLAKATTSEMQDASLTELGTLLGTPAYASPEQMSLGAIDIDTRSDVYSLGALLYELLVGVLPFGVDGAQPMSMMELRQAIRESEPPRPSVRVSRLGERLSTIAQSRGVEAPALRKQLRGDLDWVVMKALAKERERRYASPHELSLDIDRYLNHEPLEARPPATGYRLRKFVRRHRMGTAFAAVVATLIVAFIGVTLLQAQRLAKERDRATAEAAKANSINAFLQETLGSADPWQTGKDISIREVLAAAAAKALVEFKDTPLLAAEVRRTIGVTYFQLGRFAESETLLQSVLAARVQLLGKEHVDVAQVLADLGELYVQQSKLDPAEKYARDALEMRRRLFGDMSEAVASSRGQLANILFERGDYAGAAQEAEANLAVRESLYGADDIRIADAIEVLAIVVANGVGDYARAEPLFLRNHELNRRAFGDNDIRTAQAAADLATHYSVEGKDPQAEALLRAALPIMEQHLGNDHPQVATYRENLGGVLMRQDRPEEALEFAQKTLDVRREKFGNDNPKVVRTLLNIGTVQRRAGHFDEADRTYAEALPLMVRAYGEQHPDVALALRSYGRLRIAQKRPEEGEVFLRQALAIQKTQLPVDHPDTARTRSELGRLLLARRAFAESETLLLDAHAANGRNLGPEHRDTLASAEVLAELYTAWGKPDKVAEFTSRT